MEEETYPQGIQKIVDRIPERWGKWIGCGPGWYPLLIGLNEELEQIAPDYEIQQVKEKFGTLRFYFALYGDQADEYRKMSKIIDEYEMMSGKICETCGAEGSLKIRGYWYKTLCSECADRDGYVERIKQS